jgi:hypothetical protein
LPADTPDTTSIRPDNPKLRPGCPRFGDGKLNQSRAKHALSFGARIEEHAKEAREKASTMPPCPERDALLQKARQADTAAKINEWVSSPGLQPPREIAELKK